MSKNLITALCFAATVGVANAQPMPAPPTTKYTAVNTPTCDSQTLNVYFQSGGSHLSTASKALLAEAKTRLAHCMLGPASLQAIAADAASQESAVVLAQARLSSVSAALNEYHLSTGGVEEDIALTTPAKYSAPNTRKVEIRLTAWAPEIG